MSNKVKMYTKPGSVKKAEGAPIMQEVKMGEGGH